MTMSYLISNQMDKEEPLSFSAILHAHHYCCQSNKNVQDICVNRQLSKMLSMVINRKMGKSTFAEFPAYNNICFLGLIYRTEKHVCI